MIEAKTKAEQAIERNEAWAKLTPAQQLGELDRRLGKGVGAQKQRARLAKLVSNTTTDTKTSQVTVAPPLKEKKKAKERRANER